MNEACKARLGRPTRERRTLDEQLCRERNTIYRLKKMWSMEENVQEIKS